MNTPANIFELVKHLIPSGIAIAAVVIIILAVRYVMEKRYSSLPGNRFRTQIILMLLSFVGLLIVILALPISETTTGQILSLLGILLSAAIALSATTFVGNIMAGFMMRAIKNFRPGDFIRVGEHFGRVSERGLFHIEIQTEDRDLTTMPNLYLVTNPVKVIRFSGTLITAEVSLGYDVPRVKIHDALLEAATETGLTEAFVHIVNLGDFSVNYRVAGLLTDVKSLISSRSDLRKNMLDKLHQAGIEIVSPTFMNQRVFKPEQQFIPEPVAGREKESESKETPESVVFDKADEAESIDRLIERHDKYRKQLAELKDALGKADETEKVDIENKIETLQTQIERLSEYITKRKENGKN